MMDVLARLIDPAVIWVTIPLAAIILAFARKMLHNHYEHRERMAKIEAGMDPDDEELD